MTISPSLLRRYRFFRDERGINASRALTLARAEQWQEDNEEIVRVRWERDTDPDFSYLEQFDGYTPSQIKRYQAQNKEHLERYNSGYLTVEGCIVERLVVTPACAHCGRARSERWEHRESLWGIELLGHEGEEYRREVAAELLLEAMPADYLAKGRAA